MLAILILGVGVISIAALFPAGIAQQRLSVDDVLGRVVAENAIAIIRSRVKPEDFGTFEEFGANPHRSTLPGDWSWGRPTFFKQDATVTDAGFGGSVLIEKGSISIFRMPGGTITPGNAITTFLEVPWNSRKYGTGALPFAPPSPPAIITQSERYYPMPPIGSAEQYKPQYVWDCMFRRFNGKILVAVFVYRVTTPGGGDAPMYCVPPNPGSVDVPPVPVWISLETDTQNSGMWSVGGLDHDVATSIDNNFVEGAPGGVVLNTASAQHGWQQTRQWILDVNNNLYRVVGVSRPDNSASVEVELSRPITAVPGWRSNGGSAPGGGGTGSAYYYRGALAPTGLVDKAVVTDIWYMPLELPYDSNNNGVIDGGDSSYLITPVYVTVKEL